ncbi:amino acid permease [Pseudomonas sp. QL9]|uniref:amino acid permease n=1 Tax=Pseudomonas TaxID=286 RepID=UPI0005B9A219|nr:amino acid permease [Pseudomonas knackmussii]
MNDAPASAQQSAPHLKRALKPRHLNMIAIGGSIGTGLFVASGSTVATAGPGGALLAYALIGVMVFFLMTSLGEMAAYIPDSGSFSTYGSRFVDDGFGFAMGWNYWYNWAVTIAAELVAAQLVMNFWFPDVPGIYWSAGFLAIMFLLNVFSVKGFGEAEFWFALIKVVAVVIFIGIGLASIVGIMHGIDAPGFSNFTTGDAPFVGGLQAMIGVAMIAGFSFQGTELIGVAAGESEHPHKSIPKAIRQVFWRILMFYILAIFVIGMLIPYTDPNLLKTDSSDISTSPFTLLFQRAGLAAAAGVMNAVILSAILSAGNSGMYASTRMLYMMAVHGQAPRVFAQLSKSGVPRQALLATTLVGALCFLTSFIGDKTVYTWLLNTSGMCGFIVWLGIAASHYRFRKGFLAQGGRLEDLPYRAKWFPFGPLFAFSLCLAITLGQNYQAFIGERIDWAGLAATYISLPLFLAIWWGYRLKHGSRFVRYEEMDVRAGDDD